MRDLLVDHARERQAAKRGGDRQRLSLSVAADVVAQGGEQIDLLALDEALHRLAEINPRRSQVIELRFFGGLTGTEAARRSACRKARWNAIDFGARLAL